MTVDGKTGQVDKTNIACGGTFVAGDGWLNLDFAPMGPDVKAADLLATLPIGTQSLSLVYSSHFLEHIPKPRVDGFLRECYRVLKADGVLRLVLPDFEEMASEYLRRRDAGEHEQANFVVVEIIDQCVRDRPGGQLKVEYTRFRNAPQDHAAMIDYVLERTGEMLASNGTAGHERLSGQGRPLSVWERARRGAATVRTRLQRRWVNFLLSGLPTAFRAQNVSMASVGERHHWLWDFHQLREALEAAGFTDVSRATATTSRYVNFPFDPLDIDANRLSRKGKESMYVEAVRRS
jgi:hypothetical protein